MSREQWGHGFYEGVRAERLGLVPIEYEIEEIVSYFIEQLRRLDEGKDVEVERAYFVFVLFGGLVKEVFIDIYLYIIAHPGFCGCYVSGQDGPSLSGDVFILEEVS